MTKRLGIGSLFSGIGLLELGLLWAFARAGIDAEVVFQVEIDPWCRGVLAMHYPHTKRFEDVRKVGRANLPSVHLLCGGFPCQDLSSAGKGEGLAGERSGLWFEFERIIGETTPAIVVIENVATLASRGLDVVVGGLERLGYCVHGRIIAASDVGAPHKRERIFLVAHAACERLSEGSGEKATEGSSGSGRASRADEELAHAGHDGRGERGEGDYHDRRDASGDVAHRCDSDVADADRDAVRLDEQRLSGRRTRGLRDEGYAVSSDDRDARGGASQPGLGRMSDWLSHRLERWPARPGDAPALWEPPRAITLEQPTTALRLQALGNSVVPLVLERVGEFVVEILYAIGWCHV